MSNDTPLLTTRDWNEEWKTLQKVRRHADDASYWDERAKSFGTKDMPNPYVERFLELAGIRPDETVFDMGCGTGALSLPLGAAGHAVTAADFSAGMLGILRRELVARNISCVKTIQMSWEDNWEEHGVAENTVDVALASRSIATADLADSLARLTRVARRIACATLPTGSSPRTDEAMLQELGLQNRFGRDYLYAFNILAGMGIKADVSYITSSRIQTFETREEAHKKYADMIRKALPAATDAELSRELAAAREWVNDQLEENVGEGTVDNLPAAGQANPWRLRTPRSVTWAFLSWGAN